QYIAWLATQDCPSYKSLLRKALEVIQGSEGLGYGSTPDPERIHEINDGDYQGTIVFVIGAKGYQPDTYWSTTVYYGSCSGCDAIEAAWDYGRTDSMEGMYAIALNMMQGMRRTDD
ncbi:hypothetical protein LCGC14_1983120, partial [marine sediment metagenome]